MDVVSCSSVLSFMNNFDNVGAMISCTYYSGREPQKQSVLHTQSGFLALTYMVMVM